MGEGRAVEPVRYLSSTPAAATPRRSPTRSATAHDRSHRPRRRPRRWRRSSRRGGCCRVVQLAAELVNEAPGVRPVKPSRAAPGPPGSTASEPGTFDRATALDDDVHQAQPPEPARTRPRGTPGRHLVAPDRRPPRARRRPGRPSVRRPRLARGPLTEGSGRISSWVIERRAAGWQAPAGGAMSPPPIDPHVQAVAVTCSEPRRRARPCSTGQILHGLVDASEPPPGTGRSRGRVDSTASTIAS